MDQIIIYAFATTGCLGGFIVGLYHFLRKFKPYERLAVVPIPAQSIVDEKKQLVTAIQLLGKNVAVYIHKSREEIEQLNASVQRKSSVSIFTNPSNEIFAEPLELQADFCKKYDELKDLKEDFENTSIEELETLYDQLESLAKAICESNTRILTEERNKYAKFCEQI